MIGKGHRIKGVEKGSIAEELEIESGDLLLSINDKELKDVFDYQFLIHEDSLLVLIRKQDGEEWELEIEKEYQEDLGIIFEDGLMDGYMSCRNKCVFCFIDQMPKGMRESLYFKDDDSRLSYLQGNYITLTNMTQEDIDRILLYKLSPINISIHAMNKELRCKMLHNRFAGDSLEKLNQLYEGGIEMNSQIVLCKGFNDKEELNYSIKELSQFLPFLKTLSVVPVGLTKYRENLEKLETFDLEESREVISLISEWQKNLFHEHGTRFVYASDEWYLTAGLPIPEEEEYEGYQQLENGVGMVRSLTEEVKTYLKDCAGDGRAHSLSIATGVLAAPIILELAKEVTSKYCNISVTVYSVVNEFFGTDITVAGLLTGQDIIKQLSGKDLGDYLLLPDVLLKSGEPILLDDYTVSDLERSLQIPIGIVKSDGKSFVDWMIRGKE